MKPVYVNMAEVTVAQVAELKAKGLTVLPMPNPVADLRRKLANRDREIAELKKAK